MHVLTVGVIRVPMPKAYHRNTIYENPRISFYGRSRRKTAVTRRQVAYADHRLPVDEHASPRGSVPVTARNQASERLNSWHAYLRYDMSSVTAARSLPVMLA